jgi:putative oxidoreductase
MNKVASLLRLEFLPTSTDLALLVLRLWVGGSLLALHGWSKLSGFKKMAGGFPDPLKIGHQNSLILSVMGEVLCPILIVLGLFTRVGALGSAINMAVAFFLVHRGKLTGQGSGEMACLYLAAFVVILIAGSGRFAVDGKSSKGASRKPKPSKE